MYFLLVLLISGNSYDHSLRNSTISCTGRVTRNLADWWVGLCVRDNSPYSYTNPPKVGWTMKIWTTAMRRARACLQEVSQKWLKRLDLLLLLRKLHRSLFLPMTGLLVYHLPCRTQTAPAGSKRDKTRSSLWAAEIQDSVMQDTESVFPTPSPSREEEAAELKNRKKAKRSTVVLFVFPHKRYLCSLAQFLR